MSHIYFSNQIFYRVKDNHFVYCAMRIVIAAALEKARSLGITVSQIIHKVLVFTVNVSCIAFKIQTDRPSSQFWNSGMVLAHREMVAEFDVPITHITEQSMHNKVNCITNTWYIYDVLT